MKRLIFVFSVAFITLMSVGCKMESKPVAKTTVGDPYDVFIVAEPEVWRGGIVASVCGLLEDNVPASKRGEGYYTIKGHASSEGATQLDLKHSNVLKVVVDNTLTMAFMNVKQDVYAYPQSVVTLYAPSDEELVEYISSHKDEIRAAMEQGERERTINYYRAYADHALMDRFEEHTGYRMLIPNQYQKASVRSDDLLWYIRDYPTKAQYIFAFESDFTSSWDLTAEGIATSIDGALSIIPCELPDSYMGFDEDGPSYLTELTINGRKWYELRGWWEVNGDFMGGVFTSYTTRDVDSDKLVTIVMAIYAPESKQRNLLREMEHLVYTIQ